MAQNPAQFCPQCGTPGQAGQRFCSNCGATIGASAAAPTAAASYIPPAPGQAGGSGASEPTIPDTDQPALSGQGLYRGSSQSIAPPPPPTAYNPYENSLPGGPQTYEQNASSAPGYVPPPAGETYTPAPVPTYAQAPRRSRGCLVTSFILLLVLAAGVGGYFLVNGLLHKSSSNNNSPNTASTSSSNTGSSGGNTGSTTGNSSSAGSSEQLNLKITYASLQLTLLSAQFASKFGDDNSSPGQAGMVRINFHENNTTANNPGYLDSDVMLLVLPDGTTVQAIQEQQDISPNAGVSRQNWIDFPVNTQVTLNQLVLRLGKQTENQINIPLQPNADLSKYQDRTSSPNAQFQYAGVNWTLQTATLSYSYADKQATTGNRFVILTLSAKNTSSSSFTDFPNSFMRVQAGGNTVEPESSTTMPYVIASQTTGSGIVAFLVPQGTTSFTLVMLAQPGSSPAINQVTQNFQIQ